MYYTIKYKLCEGYGTTRPSEFEIGPYHEDRASVVAANLEEMRAYDFEFVPSAGPCAYERSKPRAMVPKGCEVF